MAALMKWYVVDWLGKKIRVPAMKLQGKLWFHWQGKTYVIDQAGEARRGSSGQSKANPGSILAPMPGKVTKVFVGEKASVSTGQPLIVMEAMKMEYTLEASIAGVVSELNCKAGDQVNLNQVLAKIEAAHA